MNVLSFDSHESMQQYLAAAADEALRDLHPQQRALTYGDTWVQFYDIPNRHLIFGRIHTLEEVEQAEIEAGATRLEAERVAIETEESLERGFMYGIAHDFSNPDGELGYTHKANVWPIEKEVFYDAKGVGWLVDLLRMSSKINMQAALIAWRGHANKSV